MSSTPTPIYQIPRSKFVQAKMASLAFLKADAPRFTRHVASELRDDAEAFRQGASEIAEVPGYWLGTIGAKVAILLGQDGPPIGGIVAGTVWVHPDHRGKGLGAVALTAAFELGIKRLRGGGEFYSPEGYANRSAVHWKAVERAISAGIEVPQAVLEEYSDPNHPRTKLTIGRGGASKATFNPAEVGPRKRLLAARCDDAEAFCAAILPTRDPLIVTDSLGWFVDECGDELAAIYAKRSEFTVSPRPTVQADVVARQKAISWWTALDETGRREWIEPIVVLSGWTRDDSEGDYLAIRSVLAAGATAVRMISGKNTPDWADITREGVLAQLPGGQAFLSVNVSAGGKEVMLRRLAAAPGAEEGLLAEVLGKLQGLSEDRFGQAVWMPEGAVLGPGVGDPEMRTSL